MKRFKKISTWILFLAALAAYATALPLPVVQPLSSTWIGYAQFFMWALGGVTFICILLGWSAIAVSKKPLRPKRIDLIFIVLWVLLYQLLSNPTDISRFLVLKRIDLAGQVVEQLDLAYQNQGEYPAQLDGLPGVYLPSVYDYSSDGQSFALGFNGAYLGYCFYDRYLPSPIPWRCD